MLVKLDIAIYPNDRDKTTYPCGFMFKFNNDVANDLQNLQKWGNLAKESVPEFDEIVRRYDNNGYWYDKDPDGKWIDALEGHSGFMVTGVTLHFYINNLDDGVFFFASGEEGSSIVIESAPFTLGELTTQLENSRDIVHIDHFGDVVEAL